MYEFPPPVWQNQSWSLAGILSIVLFGIVLPLVAARYSKPTMGYLKAWSLAFLVVSYSTAYLPVTGTSLHSQYHFRYLVILPCCLLLIGGITILRLWWNHLSRKEMAKSAGLAMLLFLGVMLFFCAPTVNSPRTSSVRTSCKNNLKQLTLAFHNYHDVYGALPPAQIGVPAASWRIALLPYIEQSGLAQRYDLTQPWDSPANRPLQPMQILLYACPGRPDQFDLNGRFFTSYVVPTGDGTIFNSKQGTPLTAITDGASNTLLVMEACGTEIIWTEPRDVDSMSSQLSVNGPGSRNGLSDSIISSWHHGGAQVGLADGSVRFVSQSIDPTILKSLLTRDAHDFVADW